MKLQRMCEKVWKQLERFEIFHSQVELAQKEGTILCLGDFNINLENLENPSYYLKKLADEYLTMVGELGLEILDYGVTWNRIKNGSVVKSAVDHAITNKPQAIHNYYKEMIHYSDHCAIS